MSSARDAAAYRAAGVDLTAADQVLRGIRKAVESTFGAGVVRGFGGFGGAVRVPEGLRRPVIVSSTDSVGTKVSIAAMAGVYDSVGWDIVNHCVNDVLVTGALPLAFLDYVASADLGPERTAAVIRGVAEACRDAGCPLIGGETAELPGIYRPGEFDLAGFLIGVASEDDLIDTSRVRPGDAVVALPSNGLHTNGYSLARRVFQGVDLGHVYPELGRPLGDELLAIHRSYLNDLKGLLPRVHAMAHITGGGLWDNIPRVLPEGVGVDLDWGTWQVPPIFDLMARLGGIEFKEMCRVFNMGIGMAVICAPEDADAFLNGVAGASLAGRTRRADGAGGRVRVLR